MNNLPNINEQQAANIVDDVFDDLHGDAQAAFDVQYERDYIIDFPNDKISLIINVTHLEPGIVYYKVIENDTKYDKTQLKYLRNEDGIYIFDDERGHNYIPLTSQSRFIPAYKMFPEYYREPDRDKFKIMSIPFIDDDETTDAGSSSDDEGSEMSFDGGRPIQKKQKKFHFTSTQRHHHGGKKIIRQVTIKNGKGYKKVSQYRGNKLLRTAKKTLNRVEMEMIRIGKFIPGLFRDCVVMRKKSTKRRRTKSNSK